MRSSLRVQPPIPCDRRYFDAGDTLSGEGVGYCHLLDRSASFSESPVPPCLQGMFYCVFPLL